MAKEKKKSAGEQTQEVFIPKRNKHDDAQYVAVNGRRMLVKKGETLRLPACFAQVIRHSFEAERQAEEFINSVSADK